MQVKGKTDRRKFNEEKKNEPQSNDAKWFKKRTEEVETKKKN